MDLKIWNIWNSVTTARHIKAWLETLISYSTKNQYFAYTLSFFPYSCSVCGCCFPSMTSSLSHSKCQDRIQVFFKLRVCFREVVSIWCLIKLQVLWNFLIIPKFHHMWWVWGIFWPKPVQRSQCFCVLSD